MGRYRTVAAIHLNPNSLSSRCHLTVSKIRRSVPRGPAFSAGSGRRSLGAIYGQFVDAPRQPHRPRSASNPGPSTPRTAPDYRSVPSSTTCTNLTSERCRDERLSSPSVSGAAESVDEASQQSPQVSCQGTLSPLHTEVEAGVPVRDSQRLRRGPMPYRSRAEVTVDVA